MYAIGGDLVVEDSFVGRNSKDGLCLNVGVLLSMRHCRLKNNETGACSSDPSCSTFFEGCVEESGVASKARNSEPVVKVAEIDAEAGGR